MYKILSIIPIAILIVLLSGNVSSEASIYDGFDNIVIAQLDNGKFQVCLSQSNIVISDDVTGFNHITYTNAIGRSTPTEFASISEAVNAIYQNGYTKGGLSGGRLKNTNIIIRIKGTVVNNSTSSNYFNSVDDYDESLKPKWYEAVWDTLADYFENPTPFEWFKNLIDKIFGDDNEGGTISDNVNIGAPTLAPTPTPIPYSTVVVPKTDIVTGDTVYETNYYYINPSGTPIVTSSPPTNSPSAGGGGDGSTEYNPINGDPYSLPYLDWLSNADIGENDYNGIDSIGDGLNAVDNIGSEYSDGMSAVQDSTGTLPSSWLLLIGIAAAIPLLAGIISRFLGG